MNQRLLAPRATPHSGTLASLTLLALSEVGTRKPPIPSAEADDDMGRRPELLHVRHNTLEQRGVQLGELRQSGTCIALDD